VIGKGHQLVCGAVLLVMLATGCQTSHSPKQTALDNTGFMSLWETYTHCRLSSNVSEAYRDMRTLVQATRVQNGQDGFVLPLPAKLQQLVTNPTSRFAVDVNAMASACSLHAGQLALEQGHIDLAREFFTVVVALHPGEGSSYYLAQAKTFLTEIERGVDVSLKTP
jgi:hypothetical protein